MTKERITHRLENLRETLNKNTVFSPLALKELLAPIVLEPITNESEDFYGIVKGCEKIASPATIPGGPAMINSCVSARSGNAPYNVYARNISYD